MRYVTALLVGAIALCLAGSTLIAHEVSHNGTVMAVAASKVQVKVIQARTKKESTMDFTVTAKTKVLRGAKTVTFTDANIQTNERISVTVNNDVEGLEAITIRLAAQK
jgi:hypothetical protein